MQTSDTTVKRSVDQESRAPSKSVKTFSAVTDLLQHFIQKSKNPEISRLLRPFFEIFC